MTASGRHRRGTASATARAFAAENKSADKQLARFIARYTPEIGARARAVLGKMRVRLPGAVELVGDNYNGLVIGFGPTERSSDAIFSVVLYPRWVTLFFLQGARLPDPDKLLKGSGRKVRHLVLESASDLDKLAIRALFDVALDRAPKPFDAASPRRIIIKSVSAKQRPRRSGGVPVSGVGRKMGAEIYPSGTILKKH